MELIKNQKCDECGYKRRKLIKFTEKLQGHSKCAEVWICTECTTKALKILTET